FDARAQEFIATCAPIPDSGGKVLVAVWSQARLQGRPVTQLFIWSPAVANGDRGNSALFHEGRSDYPGNILVRSRAAVVDGEAWVIAHIQRATDEFPRLWRFRVNKTALATGAPIQEQLGNRNDIGLTIDDELTAVDGGAWLTVAGRIVAFVPAEAGEPMVQVLAPLPFGLRDTPGSRGNDLALAGKP